MATTQELIAAQLMKTGGDRNVDPLSRGLASFLGARQMRQEEDRQQELKATQQNALIEALTASGADPTATKAIALSGGTQALQNALVSRLKPVDPVTLSQGQQLVNPVTGEMIAGVAPTPISLSAGSSLYDPTTNKRIAQAPESQATMQKLQLDQDRLNLDKQKAIFDYQSKVYDRNKEIEKQQKELNSKRVGGYELQEGFEPSSTDVTNFKKAVSANKNIQTNLNKLEKLFKKHDTELLPTRAASQMKQLTTAMMLEAKELFNLGVLQGRDEEILMDLIPDPTTWGASLSNDVQTKRKIQQFRAIIDDSLAQRAALNGYKPKKQQTATKKEFTYNPQTGELE